MGLQQTFTVDNVAPEPVPLRINCFIRSATDSDLMIVCCWTKRGDEVCFLA